MIKSLVFLEDIQSKNGYMQDIKPLQRLASLSYIVYTVDSLIVTTSCTVSDHNSNHFVAHQRWSLIMRELLYCLNVQDAHKK